MPDPIKFILVNTPLKVAHLLNALESATVAGFDTESAGPLLRGRKWKGDKSFINVHRSTMIGLSIGLPPAPPAKCWLKKDGTLKKGKVLQQRAYYVPIHHRPSKSKGGNITYGDLDKVILALSQVPILWIHNAKHDTKTMRIAGFPMDSWNNTVLDSYLAAVLVKGTTEGTDIKSLAFDLLGRESPHFNPAFYNMSGAEALEYAASDAINALQVGQLLQDKLTEDDNFGFFQDYECPFAVLLGEMEQHGLKLDKYRLAAVVDECRRRMRNIERQWSNLFPDIKISSDKALQELFVEGTWPDHGQRTKEGAYSLDRESLELLQGMELSDVGKEAVKLRLLHQQVSKIAGTYGVNLLEEARQFPDGRLHPDYRQAGTRTGRLSSANPNGQNIPVRSDLGKDVKACFIPSACMTYVALDYSQVELRVLAHFAGGKLAQAYVNDEDVHQQTADAVRKVAPCDRDQGKTVNFALQYGASPFRLAKILKVDIETATRVRKEILAVYPELAHLKKALIKLADSRSPRPYTKTLSGKIVYVDDLLSGYKRTREHGERQVVNSTIQGSAFDIMKMAMVETRKFFLERGEWNERVYFVNNLHDEMTLEVDDDPLYIDFVCENSQRIMENVYKLKVPLKAEPKVGKNWLECK